MHILLTGGSGFIGSNMIQHPKFNQSEFTVLTRDRSKFPSSNNPRCHLVERLTEIPKDQSFDAVINLAGAQIVGKRWSAARKQEILNSRIELTQNLVTWMEKQDSPPQILLSGSAIGYYGDTGDRTVDETDDAGTGFGAELCVAWEAEALKAQGFGTRVCRLRTGLVFEKNGGMLKQMKLPFRLCLGSQIGNGRQWMSWIHLDDYIEIVHHLLSRAESTGAYNLVSPNPVNNREFTKAFAKALNRISFLTAPAFIIKLALGEAASLLLGGQKVSPKRVEQEGFVFKHGLLPQALSEIYKAE